MARNVKLKKQPKSRKSRLKTIKLMKKNQEVLKKLASNF